MEPWFLQIIAPLFRRWRLNLAALSLAIAYATGGGLLPGEVRAAVVASNSPADVQLAALAQTNHAVGAELDAIDRLLPATDIKFERPVALVEIADELDAMALANRERNLREAALLAGQRRAQSSELGHAAGAGGWQSAICSGNYGTLPRSEDEHAGNPRLQSLSGYGAQEASNQLPLLRSWREDQRHSLHLHSLRNGAIGGDAQRIASIPRPVLSLRSPARSPFAFRSTSASLPTRAGTLSRSAALRAASHRSPSTALITTGLRALWLPPRAAAFFAPISGDFA